MQKMSIKEKKKLSEVKTLKSSNGITLIALVITIIVLLILAGVTIAMLTGDNGILTRANDAKTETEETREDELRRLTALEAATNLEDTIYTDNSKGEEKTVTIPAETAVSQVEEENTLKDGLVIIDKNGNEWVWVEVPRTVEVYPTTGINLDVNNITDDQCTTIYEDLENYANAYRYGNYADTFYSTEQHGFEDADEYNTAKNNMLRSVYKNGGFWIGRYETGIEDTYRNYESDNTSEHSITETPVIKANAYPYNYVRCNQAQILSKQLSIGGKTSSLMFGIQWDLTCKFLETRGGLTQEEIKGGDEVGSVNWGNYSNSSIIVSRGKYNTEPNKLTGQWLDITQGTKSGTMLLTTGASEDANKMNIYDFAGNVEEWTLEYTSHTDSPCSLRGGYYSVGYNFPASGRVNIVTDYNGSYIGFRASLY